MPSTFSHLEIPSTAAPEMAALAGDVRADLTLIELAGDGLRRIEAQRRADLAGLRRHRRRRERLVRRDALLDQLAALREELGSLRPPEARRPCPTPPPPLDHRDSDYALALLEAWWLTCVPMLVADARAKARELAEHLRVVSSDASSALAERLDRFAAADLGALTA